MERRIPVAEIFAEEMGMDYFGPASEGFGGNVASLIVVCAATGWVFVENVTAKTELKKAYMRIKVRVRSMQRRKGRFETRVMRLKGDPDTTMIAREFQDILLTDGTKWRECPRGRHSGNGRPGIIIRITKTRM